MNEEDLILLRNQILKELRYFPGCTRLHYTQRLRKALKWMPGAYFAEVFQSMVDLGFLRTEELLFDGDPLIVYFVVEE